MSPLNPALVLAQRVREAPDKVALHFEGSDISYAELWRRIEAAADALPVGRGERVAFLGYNEPDLLVLLFALALRAGILVPLNWRLTAAEHRRILADCEPRWLIHGAEFPAAACELACPLARLDSHATPGRAFTRASPLGDEDLLIVYTSGTTGAPRGATLTQSALVWNARNSREAHELTAQDHVLTVLPMFHVGGLNIQTVPALLAGATVTLHRRFDPGRWLSDVRVRRPTLSLLVPATMSAVIGHPDWPSTNLSSLRMLSTGSMVVPDSLIQAFHARGVPVGQIYGATETAPIALALRREDAVRKAGSAGKPVAHCEIKLVDGEVWVRGPAVMRGYWGRVRGAPGSFAAGASGLEDGWFRSGDLARVDEDGFYWIVGRSKDVIISGGENIHPAELENVLADCPAIAEAVVVGIPDDRWGEAACAAVVPAAGATLDEADVMKLFEGKLARYKHPRRIVFLPALPKNAMAKVQRAELRRLLDERLRGP
jgi:fatty-acyl-CoA synthase